MLNTGRSKLFLFGLLFLGLGVLIGRYTKEDKIITPKVLRETGFKYIKPVLLCNTDNQQTYNEDLSLTKKINDYLKNNTNDISVYYLNLTNGKWSSINDSLTFSPASMLKVPTVIDAIKYSESHPDILSRKIYYDGSFDNNKAEYFKSDISIVKNNYYSISDLMKYIIENSDNNAVVLLRENINPRSLEELYSDLKIDLPQDTIDFMSARTYSLILRVLYNSTYLTRESSEDVIEMMINSNFNLGLKAGVPNGVEVANKFGERVVYTPQGQIVKTELHDCGIVYADNANYILCAMTSGKNFESLTESISDISKIVYDHSIKN